jgi:hypothetical protein
VKQFRSIASVVAVLVILLGAEASLALINGEVVQTPRILFDEMTDARKYIANDWDESASYGNLAQAATGIERNAESLPKLFPTGTSQSDGRADMFRAFSNLKFGICPKLSKKLPILSAGEVYTVTADLLSWSVDTPAPAVHLRISNP